MKEIIDKCIIFEVFFFCMVCWSCDVELEVELVEVGFVV